MRGSFLPTNERMRLNRVGQSEAGLKDLRLKNPPLDCTLTLIYKFVLIVVSVGHFDEA